MKLSAVDPNAEALEVVCAFRSVLATEGLTPQERQVWLKEVYAWANEDQELFVKAWPLLDSKERSAIKTSLKTEYLT